MRLSSIQPKYVEHIPDQLEDGILYISERFCICSHLCACGCKEEVITPLSKAEWRLHRDRQFVSLYPSIGNWNYDCESHYYIEKNLIRWDKKMSIHQIRRIQQKDSVDLRRMLAPPQSDVDQRFLNTADINTSANRLQPTADKKATEVMGPIRRILTALIKFLAG